jgi:uncharacterized protein (DUF2141 family)
MPKNSHTETAYRGFIAARYSEALFPKAPPQQALDTLSLLLRTLLITGFCFATLQTAPAAIADTLTVRVNNIEKAGEIHIAVYDNAEAFEADRGEKGGAAPGITEGTIEMVEPGSVTYAYELPAGTYAIGIFHDVNLNNKMDNNFFGVPKEQYGFSNNARAFFGPPTFETAAFELKGATTQSIDL